jgi:sulfur-oxidizing protein SoxA
MKKLLTLLALTSCVVANAETQDSKVQVKISEFQNHFTKSFPKLTKEQLSTGPYYFSEDKLLQYEANMDMPPFEEYVEKGESLWNKPFKNGKTFSSCFSGVETSKIRGMYPYWNDSKKKVATLEQALNDCRTSNGDAKWGWKKGNIAFVSAFLNTSAMGEVINVIVPKGNKDAIKAWEQGENEYWAKRGQLNLACADCHVISPGKRIRGNILSPAYGHITHFPVWRGKWAKKSNGFGTIQRRFGGCNKMVRAKPKKAQKAEYNNLEYYLTSMSNGMEWSGTQYRE